MKGMVSRLILIVLATSPAVVVVRAQEPVDPRIAAYDKGPATIDVSKYPADTQAAYKVFVARCSKCHTIARPINCEFVLDDEWERYVKRMMRKPGSDVSPADGKQIFEFLSYDSKLRKKALYERKQKEAAKP
jgi:cytochrome c5